MCTVGDCFDQSIEITRPSEADQTPLPHLLHRIRPWGWIAWVSSKLFLNKWKYQHHTSTSDTINWLRTSKQIAGVSKHSQHESFFCTNIYIYSYKFTTFGLYKKFASLSCFPLHPHRAKMGTDRNVQVKYSLN